MEREGKPLNRKIKVLFLSPYCYPLFNPKVQSEFGGAEVDLYNLAIYLARNDKLSVDFFIGDYGQEDIETISGVHVKKIRLFGWRKKSIRQKAIHYFDFFKKLWASDADIVITEMKSDLVGWAGLFFKVIKKRHFIHRLASDRNAVWSDEKSILERVHFTFYYWGLKKADVIISQSDQQMKLLKNNLLLESTVIANAAVINNAIEFGGKKHVLWIGRGVPLKQGFLFFELARRIPEKKFVMIMPFANQNVEVDFRNKTAAWLEQGKSLSNFQHIEYVPYQVIQQYYNQAELLVNTSIYEGFPNVFIEALLGGTPIASLNVNPDNFLVEHHVGWIFDGDFERMVNFVKTYDHEKMTEMGKNAVEYVKKHHDIEVIGREYERLISDLFNS